MADNSPDRAPIPSTSPKGATRGPMATMGRCRASCLELHRRPASAAFQIRISLKFLPKVAIAVTWW